MQGAHNFTADNYRFCWLSRFLCSATGDVRPFVAQTRRKQIVRDPGREGEDQRPVLWWHVVTGEILWAGGGVTVGARKQP